VCHYTNVKQELLTFRSLVVPESALGRHSAAAIDRVIAGASVEVSAPLPGHDAVVAGGGRHSVCLRRRCPCHCPPTLTESFHRPRRGSRAVARGDGVVAVAGKDDVVERAGEAVAAVGAKDDVVDLHTSHVAGRRPSASQVSATRRGRRPPGRG
jgi:hypothetical protein